MLRRLFEHHGFQATWSKNATEALAAAVTSAPDAFIVDWCLGRGMSGLDLIPQLRAQRSTAKAPIIMLSGIRESDKDEAKAVEAGADLFFVKDEQDNRVLVRHMKALLLGVGRGEELALEGLRINLTTGEVRVDGVATILNKKEYLLLATLLRRPGVIFPLERLWEMVWNTERTDGWRHTVENRISTLRLKLGPIWGGRLVCTKGRGFSLT
jgi:two-component system catabolic regulation response regulator CreB